MKSEQLPELYLLFALIGRGMCVYGDELIQHNLTLKDDMDDFRSC